MNHGSHDLLALSQSVQQASDEQIIQVVATIDRIENRGEADKLLVPLRSRIAAIGIKRPLTLRRLTFEPLEPLIVNDDAWHSGSPMVPRRALMPLFELIRAASPDIAEWESLVPAAQFSRRKREELGQGLWDRASEALAGASAPAFWPTASGLTAEDFNAIAGVVALVLGQAANLRQLDADQDDDRNEPWLRKILAAALASGPLGLRAMLAVLTGLHRLLPLAARLAQALSAAPRHAAARAATAEHIAANLQILFIQRLNAPQFSMRVLADLADTIADLVAKAGTQGELHHAADRLRREARQSCEAALKQMVTEHVLPLLQGGEAEPGPPALRALEAQMRKLRVLGMMCERFGDTGCFDGATGTVQAALADPACRLNLVSRARLLEQLGRNQEALALAQPGELPGGEDDETAPA